MRPLPGVPIERVGRNAVVGVRHLHRLDALVPELADVLRHRQPFEHGPRILLDDERRDAFVGARGEGDDAGSFAVRDPGLRAVDDPLVAVTYGLARDVASVGPGVGFGERQRAPSLTTHHLREPSLLLLVGAEGADQRGAHRVRVDDTRERHPPVRELLDHSDVREQVETEAAVLLGNRDPEQSQILHRLDDRSRVLVGVLELAGDGNHLTGDPSPHRGDHLRPDLRVGGCVCVRTSDGQDSEHQTERMETPAVPGAP